jgi:diguanylate cyclase (GGDEF)-like protein
MTDVDGRRAVRLKILTLAAAMIVVGVPLHVIALRIGVPDAPFRVPWWGLAMGFAITEGFVVHLHVRRDAHTVSLSEIPHMFGLAAATANALVVGRLVGSVVALVLQRRQTPHKLAFNVALSYVATTASLVVYRAGLDGRSAVSLAGLGAGLIALTTSVVLSTAMVTVAIALSQSGRPLRHVVRSMSAGLVISMVAAGLAVAALALAWREPLAVFGVGVVAAVVYGALRAYGSLHQRFEDLEAVYAFTSAVDESVETEELVEAILRHSGDLFDADLTEIVMSRGVGSTVSSLRRGEQTVRRPAPPLIAEAVAAAAGPGISVVSFDDAPEEIVAHYREREVRTGAMAFVGGGAGTATMIVVAERWNGGTLTADECRIFEVLARQAGVSLERGRLVDRLRREVGQKEHQALHDALTDLPNRLQFSLVVADALRKAGERKRRVAVLLVDLDRFKEVNDTLGHERGDALLQELAMRLAAMVEGEEQIARLGGDEFGVLLREVSGVTEAIEWAKRINEVVHRPFMNEGLTIQVSASIGIAIAPEHGTDDGTLLRRADVAMYEAKRIGSSFEVYDPQRDRYSTRRLAMAGELRDAIEGGTLGVHYQPKARLSDGKVLGVEALSRWHHPRHGFVPPDEFIELAERTGLIVPLTEHVLRTALRDLGRLRTDGHGLSVAVNVAATSLNDVEFPDLVARLIGEYDADPQAVTLEVTESTMMTDSARARLVLGTLDELGVCLAIDDFGTGYSSLSYLSSLPVDEVKIDRSFVMDMAVDERLAKIVSSTTALVHSLGLAVVAEGVENRGTWDLLAEGGCDVAQGFYLARPMGFTDLSAWLASGAQPVGDTGSRITFGPMADRSAGME